MSSLSQEPRDFPFAGRILSSMLLLAFLPWTLRAVPPVTDPSFIASRNYPVGGSPSGITVADFNGDGKPDFATVNAGSNDVSVLINKGDGTYFPAVNYAVGTGPVSISVGDFNGDGKADIAVINRASSSTVSILLGNGDGTFQAQKVTNISTGILPDSLAIGDFNGDGKLDIAVTVSLPQIGQRAVAVLLGNGDGTFQAATNYDSGSGAQSAVVGDFNADGKLDIAVSDSNANVISILLGKGDGTFQPAMNTPATVPVGVISVADFNHDGKLDVLSSTSSSLFVFLGNGNGSFSAPLASGVPFPTRSVVIGDFNGDGLPDVLALGDAALVLSLGKGDGTFQQMTPFGLGASGSAAAADVNGDGKVDLAVADAGSDRVFVALGNGDGTFEVAKIVATPLPSPAPPSGSPALFALTADINGDGKMDLVVAGGTRGDGYVDVLLGNGNASFQTSFSMNIASGMRSAGPVAVGDLNRDGKPDLVVVEGDAATGVLIGNGDGTFQPLVSYAPAVSSVAVGDFNGDGIPDIIGVANGNLALWIGVGDGTFGFAKTIPIANLANALALGDFNHDGKLDVALAGRLSGMSTGEVSILLGNGDGTFQPSIDSALAAPASNIAVGDFNHDGNLDVVVTIPDQFGNPSPPPSNTIAVLLGNGNGTLQPPVYYAVGVAPSSVVVSDINNDGKPDLVTANMISKDASILLGNGDGSFQPAENFGTIGSGLTVAVADFNGDGAPDIAVPGGSGVSSLVAVPLGSGVSILIQVGAAPVPAANVAPSLVSFGNQGIGFTSATHSVTLTNGGTAALNLASISLTGPQAGDFSQTNTCGATLAAGGTCTFSITFAPSALGNRMASIVITDNAFNSPQVISLNGSGVTPAPGAGLAPAALTFVGQLIGLGSAPQVITLTNTGTAPLTISAIAINGANSSDFNQNNTCPASSSNLAIGASCTISVTFTPAVIGNSTASISVTDNASGSPQNIPLTGTGTDFSLAEASGSNCPAGGNCSTAAVIAAGQTASYNLQVTPVSGFNGSVALTCGGAPASSTCAISPTSVPPNGSSSYAFTVTINNTSSVMTLPPMDPLSERPWLAVRFVSALLLTFGILLELMLAQGRQRRLLMPGVLVLLLSFLYAGGCGGGGTGTTVGPPTSATITITGSSGGVNRTLNLSLTVNH